MTYGDISIPNNALLTKHGITEIEFLMFMETSKIQYNIGQNACQFRGASITERNMLARAISPTPGDLFLSKYGLSWQQFRSSILDKMNAYALEFYHFRKPLGSPNGKNFW